MDAEKLDNVVFKVMRGRGRGRGPVWHAILTMNDGETSMLGSEIATVTSAMVYAMAERDCNANERAVTSHQGLAMRDRAQRWVMALEEVVQLLRTQVDAMADPVTEKVERDDVEAARHAARERKSSQFCGIQRVSVGRRRAR